MSQTSIQPKPLVLSQMIWWFKFYGAAIVLAALFTMVLRVPIQRFNEKAEASHLIEHKACP